MDRQRDERGRFVKGYKGGPGRPPKNHEERYAEILKGAVTYAQFERIIKRIAKKAERGDLQAAKLLLEYLIGKPSQQLDIIGDGELILRIVREDRTKSQSQSSA